MANDMQPKGKNKALTVIIIAIVVLLVVILAVVALSKKDSTTTPVGENSNTPAATTGGEEATPGAAGDVGTPGEEAGAAELDIPEALVGAESEIEGGNLVSADNQVITQEGETAKNDVEPMSPDAPQQTAPVEEADLPDSVIKIGVSALGFDPSEIRVQSDTPVTISVTSTDTYTHIFKFEDPSMSAVAVGIAPGETRAITFQTPGPGEYTYFCDVPGHAARGETGVMIVE